MQIQTPKRTIAIPGLGVSVVLLVVTLLILAWSHTAHANDAPQTRFLTYTAPTGPEMSASAIAAVAVRSARRWGNKAEIRVELARGTLMQAETLMEGGSLATARAQEERLQSDTSDSAFCSGSANASCTPAEAQRVREARYREAETSAYLAIMSSRREFAPPERLRRGAKPVVARKVVLVIDAHTGHSLAMAIGPGRRTPRLSDLSRVSRFVAAPRSMTVHLVGSGRNTHLRSCHGRLHCS